MRIATILTSIILAVGIAGYSYPAAAACVFAGGGVKYDSHLKLLDQASIRIESKFGSMRSQPVVYFFESEDSYWPLRLNPYGSTSFLGYKTCVAIGPHGQNVDVIAHELMHAEIEERAGFFNRTIKIPVWFDEGLAMQVDYRDQYKLDKSIKTAYARELKTSRKFNQANNGNLTLTYGAVKSEVQAWPPVNSPMKIFGLLEKIRLGSSFDSIWENSE